MSTFFFDIDGTLVRHSTTEMLPNAVNMLIELKKSGHKIILITRRGDQEWGPDDKIYSKKPTLEMLKNNKVPYDDIIFDVSSPRIIVDDEISAVIRREPNKEWCEKETEILKKIK